MNAYKELEAHKRELTRQQYKTLKGQIRAGDEVGAMKGLAALIRRKTEERNPVVSRGSEK